MLPVLCCASHMGSGPQQTPGGGMPLTNGRRLLAVFERIVLLLRQVFFFSKILYTSNTHGKLFIITANPRENPKDRLAHMAIQNIWVWGSAVPHFPAWVSLHRSHLAVANGLGQCLPDQQSRWWVEPQSYNFCLSVRVDSALRFHYN